MAVGWMQAAVASNQEFIPNAQAQLEDGMVPPAR